MIGGMATLRDRADSDLLFEELLSVYRLSVDNGPAV